MKIELMVTKLLSTIKTTKMKRVLTAIVCLFFTIQLHAQEQAAPYYGFRLGLTAHPTVGFLKVENGKSNGISLGFSYGLIGDFNFAENYSFSTGLTVTTINGKSTELFSAISGSNQVEWNYKYKMQYIEIPLTIKLKTGHIAGIRWFGQFGLSNDFRIASHRDIESKQEGLSAENVDAKDATRFYRAGMIIGGGGEFDISGNTSLMLGLTLNNGFTTISKGESSIRNHYVGINVGVFF